MTDREGAGRGRQEAPEERAGAGARSAGGGAGRGRAGDGGEPAGGPGGRERRRNPALRELDSAALLEATLDATTDGIAVTELDGRLIGANDRFREMWEIPDEMVADSPEADRHFRGQLLDPDGFAARTAELQSSPELAARDVLLFRDGRVVERYSTPRRVAGKPVGRVWSFRDVTAQRRAERDERMESLGLLAGGVAHDFNNLLTVILSYAHLLAQEDLGAHAEPVREIERAATHGATLTRQLLLFARQEQSRSELLDLNGLISETLLLVTRTLGEQVRVATELAPDLKPVVADGGQLAHVLINLAANARDAMPNGGTFELRTANLERSGADAVVLGGASAGTFVQLTATDTGAGIGEAAARRAFEPFFTTKRGGTGTGLGLATVHGIVTQAGGQIRLERVPAGGTRCTIVFPAGAAEDVAAAATQSRGPAAAPGKSETVLVVEDDPAIRAVVEQTLVGTGYRVLAADCGEHALALAGEHATIDLLLTDGMMPGGISGDELARRLPSLPVVYMSGYPAGADDERGLRGRLLRKPFTPDALTRAVREALDASRA